MPGVLGRRQDGGRQVGLLDPLQLLRLGQLRRAVHLDDRAVGQAGPVLDARRGGDQRQVELPLEALPDDLHVQQTEEAAPEAEAQRPRGLGLVGDGGVVEAQLLQGLPQVGEVVALDRVQPAEHHGLGILVALQGRGGRTPGVGDRLAAAGLADVLDAGDEVADLARARGSATGTLIGVRTPISSTSWVRPVCMNRSRAPDAQGAVDDPDGADDPPVLVVVGVEDQALQGGVGVPDRAAGCARRWRRAARGRPPRSWPTGAGSRSAGTPSTRSISSA